MGKILVLALAAAVYPTLLAIVVLILTRPHPIRLFAGYLIGGMIMSLAIGLLILGLADTSNIDANNSSAPSPWIDTGLGLALLWLAWTIHSGRDLPGAERRAARKDKKAAELAAAEAAGESPKDSASKRLMERDSMLLSVAIGAALSLPSVWYLEALREIDSQDYTVVGSVLAVLIFNLIMFALIEIPLAYYLLKPDKAADAVARFHGWTRNHTREIGMWVCGVAGAGLLIDGLLGLT